MIREILEKYVDSHRSVKEWDMMLHGNIPITPSMMKSLETTREMYHITDVPGLINLKKIEGQKKIVAGFTRGSDTIADGALTDGTVLVKLKGKSPFSGVHDLGTFLDRNGNRWLPWDQIVQDNGPHGDFLWNNFTKPMTDKQIIYFGVKTPEDVFFKVQYLDGKGKNKFIKWYFDESKKILTKKFFRDLQMIMEEQKYMWYGSDEVLMHSFKIQEIKVVTDSRREYVEKMTMGDLAEIGIVPKGKITRKEIERLKL